MKEISDMLDALQLMAQASGVTIVAGAIFPNSTGHRYVIVGEPFALYGMSTFLKNATAQAFQPVPMHGTSYVDLNDPNTVMGGAQ